MNSPHDRPVISITLICLILMNVSTASAAPEALPFWKRAKVEVPQKLSPAKVELLAEPNMTMPLAIYDPQYANFKVGNPLSIPFVKVAKEPYRVIPDGLTNGAKPFSDREYAITALPERLSKLTLVQTKMADKVWVDSRFGIVLSASRPVYLFLAIDERMLATFEKSGTPGWMQEFAPTGEKIVTDDPLMKLTENAGFLVFVKKCPAGRIVLGPCCADPNYNSMYVPFFADAGQADK